jgi:hypothetical protein
MTRPAKARPRRSKRQHDIDQARFDLRPQETRSDLDREVQEFAKETRREPLPAQAELPWKEKP